MTNESAERETRTLPPDIGPAERGLLFKIAVTVSGDQPVADEIANRVLAAGFRFTAGTPPAPVTEPFHPDERAICDDCPYALSQAQIDKALDDAVIFDEVADLHRIDHVKARTNILALLSSRKSPAPPTAEAPTQGERLRKPNFDIGSEARGDG